MRRALRGFAGTGEADREEVGEEGGEEDQEEEDEEASSFWRSSSSTSAVACSSRCVPFGRRLAPDARHRGRYGPEGQCHRRHHGSGVCVAGIAGNALRVVFPSVVVRPIGIWVGMDQKNRCVARCFHAVVHMPVVCNDRCHGLRGAENCGFSEVTAPSTWLSTSLS